MYYFLIYVPYWSAAYTSHCTLQDTFHCCIANIPRSVFIQLVGVVCKCLLNEWMKNSVKLKQIFLTRSFPVAQDLGPLNLLAVFPNLTVFNPGSSRSAKPQKDWHQKDSVVSLWGPRDREMLVFIAKEYSPCDSCSCLVHHLWQLLDPCQPQGQKSEFDKAEESIEPQRQVKWHVDGVGS